MLDLQVFGVILTVILFSLGSIILISKLPKGKTFDEMLEEKRQLKAQLLAAAGHKSEKQSKKEQNAKRGKRANKPQLKGKAKQKAKVQEEYDEQSDSQSERSSDDSSAQEREFIETEAFQITESIPARIGHKFSGNKKNNKNKGILVNKSEPVLVKETPVVEETNHFEEIQPKDVVELHRAVVEPEILELGSKVKNNGNNASGKKNKRNVASASPTNPKDNKQTEEVQALEKEEVQVKEKEKTSTNKKKKEDKSVTEKAVTSSAPYDDDSVRAILRSLSSAELTRNEIQILIDFLLNKQHDTTAKDPTEWSEGKSDVLQKLKRQLQDREKQLQEEQQASTALQTKLRELRYEINTEKSQFNATVKAYNEEINKKKKEVQDLSTQLHYSNEKHNAEKVALNQQCQQMQSKLIQMKNESSSSQEAIQKFQQLTIQTDQLKQEILSRDKALADLQRVDNEHRQFNEGLKKTLAECEQKLRDYESVILQKDGDLKFVENELRQRGQDLGTREQEVQHLRLELSKKAEELDHFYKSCESFKVQLAEAHSMATNQTHMEDANKVEIKNLQNALDSSRKELNSFKTQLEDANSELSDFRLKSNMKSTETGQQMDEMKSLVGTLKAKIIEKDNSIEQFERTIAQLQQEQSELRNELESQKQKNNDLRTKNWKLIEALQAAQNSKNSRIENVVPQSSTHQAVENTIDEKEQSRIKELFSALLPDLPSTAPKEFSNWIEFVSSYVQSGANAKRLSNHTSDTNSVSKIPNNNAANLNGSEAQNDKAKEVLLLQNAQLQKSLDEYKRIVADTEQVLRNLEAKVSERDTYWLSVVQSKEEEISSLKQS